MMGDHTVSGDINGDHDFRYRMDKGSHRSTGEITCATASAGSKLTMIWSLSALGIELKKSINMLRRKKTKGLVMEWSIQRGAHVRKTNKKKWQRSIGQRRERREKERWGRWHWLSIRNTTAGSLSLPYLLHTSSPSKQIDLISAATSQR